jgi:hypothetical protein
MAGLCDVAKVFDGAAGSAGSMNNRGRRGELRGQRAATRLQMSKRMLHRRLVYILFYR